MAGYLLFSADDGSEGREAFVTQLGSRTVTQIVINPGPGDALSVFDSYAAAIGDTVVFWASEETGGSELWRLDGVNAASRVADIHPGTGNADPTEIRAINGTFYFSALNPDLGGEVWASDGTADGTRALRDINPGPGSGAGQFFTAFQDGLLFRANDGNGLELWRSDGTEAGTRLVKALIPESPNQSGVTFLEETGTAGPHMYFSGKTTEFGIELWRTDGTADGTVQVADIAGGSTSGSPNDITVLGDTVVFSAYGGFRPGASGGRELWVSDGTETGTRLLVDINPGLEGSDPAELTRLGNRIIFEADDGTTGEEIWITDGTASGTVQLADLTPGNTDFVGEREFTPIGDGSRVVFRANDDRATGNDLWITDGTPDGTRMLAENVSAGGLFAAGDYVYFNGGGELWLTDGTPAGTFEVADINTDISDIITRGRSDPIALVAFGTENRAPDAPVFFAATIGNDAAPGTRVGTVGLSDPDNQALTLALTDDAGGLFALDGRNLVLAAGLAGATAAEVTLRVTDGAGGARSETIALTFEDVAPAGRTITGSDTAEVLTGDTGDDTILGLDGNDRLLGEAGNDSLDGGLGADTLNGGDGDDTLIGGPSEDDLRDVIYAGEGNDSVDAGAGNDLIFGQGGNDTIAGGFGVDEIQGQDGDDVITGSAFSDLVFGGAGNDFVNGGFGHDRINGGSGADKFFHVGVEGHGSDWVQDYSSAEGDALLFGNTAATRADFQVNFAHTQNAEGERAGDDAVQEAFVIYRPTGQIMWALVDGAGQSSINLQIGSEVFDLLA
ncbi:hypothetical protein [Ruegeria aquimaris]|uniref:Hemolysin, chromosomal n=1 Tax=Ruegeria aquimaris TaxID=2984333 RepID=A0ABT3AQM9_9RHOB|nr:hypothetical protein [Ruegeria sp. XHP0148]MCV2890978.1 hypothetical protein [Ruegeria sp. XHP0148]